MRTDKIITSFTGDYFFLSNFYRHPVEFDGILYPTNEHAFQAAKTLDNEMREKISYANTAAEAKSLGRRIELRPHWDEFWRYQVMETLIWKKFNDSYLWEKLWRTRPAILIEGNTWGDTTWGMIERPGVGWVGQNLLGWMLMRLRDKL